MCLSLLVATPRTVIIAERPSVSCLIVRFPLVFTGEALSLLSGPRRHLWRFEKFGLIARRCPLR